MIQRVAGLVLFVLLALPVPAVTAEEAADREAGLAKTARTLSELFLAGEYERSHELMSAKMRDAFTTEMAPGFVTTFSRRRAP